jgi:carotenoid cleavage dioxygenase-like enzyme
MAIATPRTTGPELGFTTLEDEVTIDALEMTGTPPAWLSGSLLRTGPAKFEVGEQHMRHWFDGLAMLHRFSVADGTVSYGSRFLRSGAYKADTAEGRIAYPEFATDPCRSLFKRVQSMFSPLLPDNANVNVTKLGNRHIAMTETPLPVQFDAQTLETVDVRAYEAPGQLTTAHPHLDRATGGMVNFAAKLGPKTTYRFFTVGPDATSPEVLTSIPVREPSYTHSFGQTERWLVLAEFPFRVNPLKLAFAGRPYIENYRWKADVPTRFILVDRHDGTVVDGFETDACFAFHHVNAYDDEHGEVVVDICTYPDATIVEDLYLDRLRAGKGLIGGPLMRYRLNVAERSVTASRIGDTTLELPRINYGRCHERQHRYVWGNESAGTFVDRIVKVDVIDGAKLGWEAADCYPGEPVFVARPGAEAEDDGVLLSVVLDAAASTSFLLILDAATLDEVARARVPHHIPFGFHGQFERARPAKD